MTLDERGLKYLDLCDQIWQNFATLAQFKSLWAISWMVYFVFGKLLYPLWHFYASGQIVFAVNGHTLNNNIAVWSHWLVKSKQNLSYLLPEDATFAYFFTKTFHWLRQIATTLCEFHEWFWIIILDAITKAEKIICKSIAQNLKQISLTKSFLALPMAFNLLLSNQT